MILPVLQIVLLVLVGLYFVSILTAHVLTWYYFAHQDPPYSPTGYEPPVSIIKPTRGIDQSALDNFRTFCEQNYSNVYELLFCVEEQSDPSVPVIKRIIEEHPDKNIRLIFSDPKDTRSFGKLKNMMAGLAGSSYDVIIFSDSDARVPPTFLRETVACMQNPEIGLGFGAPAYEGSDNWAAALTSITVNGFVLWLAPLYLLGLFAGAVGTTMVVRRDVIKQIGGLDQLVWQIGDDIPLAEIIYSKGYRVHLLKQPARIFHYRDSFTGWWSHSHRWLVIIRRYMPIHFGLMSMVDLSLWWGIFYLITLQVQGSDVLAGIYLLVAGLTTSLISAAVVNSAYVHNRNLWRFLWVVLVQKILWLPLLIYSCMTNEVVWRGRRLRVFAGGMTQLVGTPEAAHD